MTFRYADGRINTVVQEMKKLIRRSALVGVLLILAIGVFAFLQFRGTIPSFADTSDPSYEKLCGFEPSHGRVWTTSSGFGSGGAFYRLNLARSAYSESRATILTESNRPPLPQAPWWWGAKPNGKVSVFLGSGLGFNTQSYQVYDPDNELLSLPSHRPGTVLREP
jgi:hypothetical protein